MPRLTERLKAPTPRTPTARNLQAHKIPDLASLHASENLDPHGYAAKMQRAKMRQRGLQVQPAADASHKKAQPFPSPKVAYAFSDNRVPTDAPSRPASPLQSVASSARSSPLRSSPMRMLSSSNSAPELRQRRAVSYATAIQLHLKAHEERMGRAPSRPSTPPPNPEVSEDCVAQAAVPTAAMPAAVPDPLAPAPAATPPEEPTSPLLARPSEVAVVAPTEEQKDGTTTASAAEESDTITLERADFRQLVVALRNLRQQREDDKVVMRQMRHALADVVSLSRANDHVALREYIAEHLA